MTQASTSTEGRDLILTRVIDVPPEKVFRAWTEPELLRWWFAPKPWTTPSVETDVRAGGSSLIVMRSPDGSDFPNRGVYLEVVKNRALGVHRCIHQSVGAVNKTVYDGDLDVRGSRRQNPVHGPRAALD